MKRDLDKVITKNEQFEKIRNSLQDKIKKLENENLALGQNQRYWKMLIEREKKLTKDERNLEKQLKEFKIFRKYKNHPGVQPDRNSERKNPPRGQPNPDQRRFKIRKLPTSRSVRATKTCMHQEKNLPS